MKLKKFAKKRKSLARNIGKVIAEQRVQIGLTQAQLASDLGTRLETVSRFETANIETTLNRLAQFSDYFCCPVETFFRDQEEDLETIIHNLAYCFNLLEPKEKDTLTEIMKQISRLYITELPNPVSPSQPI